MFAPCSFTTCMHAQTDRPTRLATNGFPTQTFFPESFLFRIPNVYLCIVLCAKSRKNLSLKKPSRLATNCFPTLRGFLSYFTLIHVYSKYKKTHSCLHTFYCLYRIDVHLKSNYAKINIWGTQLHKILIVVYRGFSSGEGL